MKPNEMIIYSDLDGTLLTSWDLGPIISKGNHEAILEFIKQGGLFSIATGRNIKNGPKFLDPYKIELPMVLMNGALIYDQQTKTILKKTQIPPKFTQEMVSYFTKHDHVSLVVSEPNEYFNVIHPNTDCLPDPDFDFKQISISEMKSLDVIKMTLICHEDDRDQIQNDIQKFQTIKLVNLFASSNRFIEIVDQSVHKGNAIKYVINHLNLKKRKLICIGDFLNDEDMLNMADIAAVPKNGLEVLKKSGRIKTRNHNESAIEDLINQLTNDIKIAE